MAPQPSWRGNLGFAKEAVYGTIVAPTFFAPVQNIKPKRNIIQLEDKNWRGSAVEDYGMVQGPWFSELEIPMDVYPDAFGWALASILGDITFAVVGAGVNAHRFHVLNSGTMQPPSKTLTDFYSANARSYPGALCVEVSIKWTADGKVTATSKWVSLAETAVATPVAAYSTEKLMAAWRATVTVLGATPPVTEGEFNMKRTYDVIHTADNTQDPFSIFLGPLAVDGKVTFVMENDTYLNHFYNATEGAITQLFTIGAGATLRQLELRASLAEFHEGEIDRGSSYVKLPLTFKGFGNATDAGPSGGLSPCRASVLNLLPTGTYI